MKFFKTRNVKSPNRGTKKSVGIDFFVPVFASEFIKDLKAKNIDLILNGNRIILEPHQSILIPSGIKVKLPDNYFLNAFNKSSVSSKKNLIKLAETVDEDYQGELHISIINISNKTQMIVENEKLIQFILLPALYSEIEEEKNLDLMYNETTERADKGFGSTNKE